MNKYTYTSLMIVLQTFSLVTIAHGADFKFAQKNQAEIREDKNLSLKDLFNLNQNKLTLNDVINLIENNNLSLLENVNPNDSLNLAECSVVSQLGDTRPQNSSGVRFLPQAKDNNILKGIYDYSQDNNCQESQNQPIISRLISSQPSQKEDNFELKPISLLDYEQNDTEFKPIQTNYTYQQTAQELNTITNSNRQSFNYQNNYTSLSLIKSIAINPISIVTNVSKNNQIFSDKPAFGQPVNPQYNINYFNAITGQGTGINSVNINGNGITSYQSQVPSSPILEKMKQEMEKQQQQGEKQQKQQEKQIKRQLEQQRRQQERQAEQRREKQEQEQQKRQQQLQQQQQKQQSNLSQRR